MRKNLTFFIAGVAIFFLFVLFSYIVHKDHLTQFDFDLTVRLQDSISRRLDDLFSLFSTVGSFEPMAIILLITVVIWRKILTGVALLVGFVAFHVFEIFGKFFVDHLPPPEFMLRTKHAIDFPQFHVRADNSYPSGHSGRAVFYAAMLLFIIWSSKRLSYPVKILLSGGIAVYVVTMLISRVYLGEHWTTDVIGGGLLGLALSLIALATYKIRPVTSVRKHKIHEEI